MYGLRLWLDLSLTKKGLKLQIKVIRPIKLDQSLSYSRLKKLLKITDQGSTYSWT